MIRIKKIKYKNREWQGRQLTDEEKIRVVAVWGDEEDYIFFEASDVNTPEWLAFKAHTTIEPSPIDLIMAEYDRHEENGKQLHKQIRASLVLRLKNKELTLNNVLAIEDKLSNITNNVRGGDWLTAKAKLEAAQTNGVFTEELKADILKQINNYITANYK